MATPLQQAPVNEWRAFKSIGRNSDACEIQVRKSKKLNTKVQIVAKKKNNVNIPKKRV